MPLPSNAANHDRSKVSINVTVVTKRTKLIRITTIFGQIIGGVINHANRNWETAPLIDLNTHQFSHSAGAETKRYKPVKWPREEKTTRAKNKQKKNPDESGFGNSARAPAYLVCQ